MNRIQVPDTCTACGAVHTGGEVPAWARNPRWPSSLGDEHPQGWVTWQSVTTRNSLQERRMIRLRCPDCKAITDHPLDLDWWYGVE